MLADFFAAGALIKARLAAQIPALKAVYDAWEIAQLRNSEQAIEVPSADVIYLPDGIKVVEQIGIIARIEQTWGVVLRSRPDGDTVTGDLARAEMGGLVMQALAALHNWAPSPDLAPLVTVNPPDKLYEYVGEIEFPLAFATQFTLSPQRRF